VEDAISIPCAAPAGGGGSRCSNGRGDRRGQRPGGTAPGWGSRSGTVHLRPVPCRTKGDRPGRRGPAARCIPPRSTPCRGANWTKLTGRRVMAGWRIEGGGEAALAKGERPVRGQKGAPGGEPCRKELGEFAGGAGRPPLAGTRWGSLSAGCGRPGEGRSARLVLMEQVAAPTPRGIA